ncbi:U2 small nuclear ribonucleoprotein A'-like isoform X1 [Tachypleus tridentatus]|uniref:U2 small nuclear ribonucleoprotein A'-like isoform X1 n=1 Tax=Tachypleus tridentatus TaxID=6853 RepID=UPI003FD68DB9
MVKLTPELIELSAQYVNPVRDRELNLRGYKIPVIENLGATLDQFDTIDLSDNDIRKIDGFPLLRRLKTLLISNNRICRIAENLHESLPCLENLVLTNNHIQELGDIDPLATVRTLASISLLRNPVATKKYYRLYLIHKLPQLRLIDFRKVKQKERDEASTLFKGKRGKKLEKEIGRRSKTFVPGGALGNSEKKTGGPSASDIEAIKTAIAKATTLEEVERLNQMLKSGQLPGKELLKMNQTSGGRKNETDDEDETMDTESGAVNGN